LNRYSTNKIICPKIDYKRKGIFCDSGDETDVGSLSIYSVFFGNTNNNIILLSH